MRLNFRAHAGARRSIRFLIRLFANPPLIARRNRIDERKS